MATPSPLSSVATSQEISNDALIAFMRSRPDLLHEFESAQQAPANPPISPPIPDSVPVPPASASDSQGISSTIPSFVFPFL